MASLLATPVPSSRSFPVPTAGAACATGQLSLRLRIHSHACSSCALYKRQGCSLSSASIEDNSVGPGDFFGGKLPLHTDRVEKASAPRSGRSIRAAKSQPGVKKKTKRAGQPSSLSQTTPSSSSPPSSPATPPSSPSLRPESPAQTSPSPASSTSVPRGGAAKGGQNSTRGSGATFKAGEVEVTQEGVGRTEGGAGGGGQGGPVAAAASRERVLSACSVTSGGIAAAGLLLRQGSHWAAEAGWPLHDCTQLMPFSMASWHVGVGAALLVGVSGIRLLLLQCWPEFAAASNASNRQVLSNLEPLDLLWVSFLPGISEELLFRGAVLPLVEPDWRGVLVAGAVFGALHVGGNRNAAFALWAAAVGVAYGAAAVATSDLGVPIVAHSLANLAAAAAWRAKQSSGAGSGG